MDPSLLMRARSPVGSGPGDCSGSNAIAGGCPGCPTVSDTKGQTGSRPQHPPHKRQGPLSIQHDKALIGRYKVRVGHSGVWVLVHPALREAVQPSMPNNFHKKTRPTIFLEITTGRRAAAAAPCRTLHPAIVRPARPAPFFDRPLTHECHPSDLSPVARLPPPLFGFPVKVPHP